MAAVPASAALGAPRGFLPGGGGGSAAGPYIGPDDPRFDLLGRIEAVEHTLFDAASRFTALIQLGLVVGRMPVVLRILLGQCVSEMSMWSSLRLTLRSAAPEPIRNEVLAMLRMFEETGPQMLDAALHKFTFLVNGVGHEGVPEVIPMRPRAGNNGVFDVCYYYRAMGANNEVRAPPHTPTPPGSC
jgi:hypothetical protein